jgi:hypothetical protein
MCAAYDEMPREPHSAWVRDAELPAPDGRCTPDGVVLKRVAQGVSTDHPGRAHDDELLLARRRNVHSRPRAAAKSSHRTHSVNRCHDRALLQPVDVDRALRERPQAVHPHRETPCARALAGAARATLNSRLSFAAASTCWTAIRESASTTGASRPRPRPTSRRPSAQAGRRRSPRRARWRVDPTAAGP